MFSHLKGTESVEPPPEENPGEASAATGRRARMSAWLEVRGVDADHMTQRCLGERESEAVAPLAPPIN